MSLTDKPPHSGPSDHVSPCPGERKGSKAGVGVL